MGTAFLKLTLSKQRGLRKPCAVHTVRGVQRCVATGKHAFQTALGLLEEGGLIGDFAV